MYSIMAVPENGGLKIGPSGQNLENTVAVSSTGTNAVNDSGKSKTSGDSVAAAKTTMGASFGQDKPAEAASSGDGDRNNTGMLNGFSNVGNGGDGEIFKRNMSDLVEILSKLNPMAEEFVPPSLANHQYDNHFLENGFGFSTDNFAVNANSGNANGYANRRKRNNSSQGKRRLNNRTSLAQREDSIRKTVYVSDIDLQVTEELLAGLFLSCGPVVDCRICGDTNSVLRFAFVEFYKEEDAKAALNLSGTILGYYPLKVMPSKTAIAPVNPTFLPRSEDEREMCARTIYCTNIDKKVTQAEVKRFFESYCGEVQRLRLLGDYHHSTRIAFVEFTMAESAIAALNCSGVVMGSQPIRVSPSKTPVRARAPRPAMH
ncbi:hypothetical protein V6N13_021641 [Hibiscus sabdariffa]|uniref:RRM domain-containing protein n=1 Tax=Hibiscus sabdariffa TaxID=183260 RepID=A0ABR2B9T5_9ROSI